MSCDAVTLCDYDQYPDKERLERLSKQFSEKFANKKVEFFCRAPGRVNLIGEHIDYCGYGVLPMAISQDMMVAVAGNEENKLRLFNTFEKYTPYEATLDQCDISQTKPQWHHYFLCGIKGILERLKKDGKNDKLLETAAEGRAVSNCGIDVLLEGLVPPCAGLSSSSALVCAAALATMVIFASPAAYSKLELAELCQHSEKYIGTEGGGMDQAISFLAQPGKAKYVEFNPLRVTDLPIPSGACFVIANSCVQLNKAATSHYNTRVAECRLAAQLIAKSEGRDWRSMKELADVQAGLSLDNCCDLVRKHVSKEVYSRQKLSASLGVKEEDLNLGSKVIHEFKPFNRAMHVFSEARRVLQFKKICEGADEQTHNGGKMEGDEKLEELGRLMNESHASCKDDYECSCPELDELVDYARKHGALGCRLTGAGWGGCCVMLVPTEKKEALLKQMELYYKRKGLSDKQVNLALFATYPGNGASIIKP